MKRALENGATAAYISLMIVQRTTNERPEGQSSDIPNRIPKGKMEKDDDDDFLWPRNLTQ